MDLEKFGLLCETTTTHRIEVPREWAPYPVRDRIVELPGYSHRHSDYRGRAEDFEHGPVVFYFRGSLPLAVDAINEILQNPTEA